MKLLEEIRSQPAHIREVFMWLCVVISFSVISFFWVQSTEKQFVATINPQQAEANEALAKQEDEEQASVTANVGDAFSVFKDKISELFGLSKEASNEFNNYFSNQPAKPNLFPVSEEK